MSSWEFGYFDTKSSRHLTCDAGTLSFAQACSALYSAIVYGGFPAGASCPAAAACAWAEFANSKQIAAAIARPATLRVPIIPISPRSNYLPDFFSPVHPGQLPGTASIRKTLGL